MVPLRGICAGAQYTLNYHTIRTFEAKSFMVRGSKTGQWCMVQGAWCMVHGVWFIVHGEWYLKGKLVQELGDIADGCMVHGAWCMVHGALCMVPLESTSTGGQCRSSVHIELYLLWDLLKLNHLWPEEANLVDGRWWVVYSAWCMVHGTSKGNYHTIRSF